MKLNQLLRKSAEFFASFGQSRPPITIGLIARVDDGSPQNELSLVAFLDEKREQELESGHGIEMSATPRPMLSLTTMALAVLLENLSNSRDGQRSTADKFAIHRNNKSGNKPDPDVIGAPSTFVIDLSQSDITLAINDSSQPRKIGDLDCRVGLDGTRRKFGWALGFQVGGASGLVSSQFGVIDNRKPFFERPHFAPTGFTNPEGTKLFASNQFALENKGVYALSAKSDQCCDFINSIGAHTMNTIVAQAEMQATVRVI